MENGLDVSKMLVRSFERKLPTYDFSKKSEPGTFPIADGLTFWMGGTTIYAYNADRLPAPFDQKVWHGKLLRKGEKEAVDVDVPVDWPYLTRVVHVNGSHKVLKAISPRGNLRRGADGALWITAFSGEGHIDPSNGQYSPYYSAELFRSGDEGKSFQRVAHMEYPADGKDYPYRSGGFSDSDVEFMPDGSMVWFFRSNCDRRGMVADVLFALDRHGQDVVEADPVRARGHAAEPVPLKVRVRARLLRQARNVRAGLQRRFRNRMERAARTHDARRPKRSGE